jgi:UrcA family protein
MNPCRIAATVAVTMGTFLGASAVPAQQGERPMEIVRVVAPRTIEHVLVGREESGSNVEVISLTRQVPYKDLDLSLSADVDTLRMRVRDIATESCDTLAKMYPFAAPSNPDCLRSAIASAENQITEAVTAAQTRGN